MNRRRHRILYVERPASVGGSVISLFELVRGLDKSLYEPVILFHRPNRYREQFQSLGLKVITVHKQMPPTVGPAAGPQRDIAARLSRYGNWLGCGYRKAKEVYAVAQRDWPLTRWAARLIREEGIDLVHQNNNLTGNRDTVVAAWLACVPQVCHVRGFQDFLLAERHLARCVNTFIYISKAVEQYYRNLGIPADKGQIVYDAFNAEAFGQANHTTELRAEFGLTEQDWLISNVGRLEWWKGHEYFIQAIAEVIRLQPNTKALIVGEADCTHLNQTYYQKLQQLVIDWHLAEHVIFAGFRSDVPRIMAASDIVVHSSSEPEPFGIVVIEAMAMGRPVVATAAGGVLDIIESQVNGLLVPPKNASLMAKAIQQLLQNREQANSLGRRAQQDVRERFSIEQHVTAVQHIYQKFLSS